MACWSSFLKSFPAFRNLLAFIGQKNSVDLGGLYHRGRSSYSMECVGLVYLILFIWMIMMDFIIIAPVARGDIIKVATD